MLIGVGAGVAAGLVLQELTRAEIPRLEQCPRNSRGVLILQLGMLNEGALSENLHEAVIYNLHLVRLVKVDGWVIELLPTAQILGPEGVRDVD